jgi:hypothetical protein
VKPTENIAKSASAPKVGRFATLCARLRGKGSGAGAGAFEGSRANNVLQLTAERPALAIIAATLLASAGLTAALPATVSAYATPAPNNIYSSAPGLPDGRVYEEASPANDDGNEAGAQSLAVDGFTPGSTRYSIASAEGDSVLFEGTGPMGEAASPTMLYFVATRTSSGWNTRSVEPRPLQLEGESASRLSTLVSRPGGIYMSQDFSGAAVQAGRYTLAQLPGYCGGQDYLTGPDPFVPATWLSQPQGGTPSEFCTGGGIPIGGSPNLSTVYFESGGRLLPEDASRAPHHEVTGFYEYSEGALREAGVLPDGKLDEFGAVPADDVAAHPYHHVAFSGNEVSADGSRAFFVSPDPQSCSYEVINEKAGENNCALDPPELYVRENGSKSVLVSKDTLLPEVGGLPASAPDGAHPVNIVEDFIVNGAYNHITPYVFASPDGSQAFFQSEDRLTAAAPEGPPGDTSAKSYDFDVNTGELTYLPNVVGRLVGTDTDGSSLVFVSPASKSSAAELELWAAGPSGGRVTPIVQLPPANVPTPEEVEPVRVSSDGSVVVFSTASILPGFNDGGTYENTTGATRPNEQIYRYDVSTNTLGCVSCAPPGVAPGNASMSILREGLLEFSVPANTDERGMSANGDRVFFETQAPLVPQDTNTATFHKTEGGVIPQGMDVYEWENGVVYLISSGKSDLDSYFLDSSESGDDVFFATTEGLVPGDTDGGYSVYDARVPRPGDNPPPAAVPCEGAVCQGPPNVPSPLTPPASATFSGLGNPAPEAAATPAPAKKATTRMVRCRKGFVKQKDRCVRAKTKKKAKKASDDRRVKS